MKADPTDTTPTVRRLTLLSLPPLAVHLGIVLVVAAVVVTLHRAGVERALDRVRTALLAFGVAALAAFLVYLARSRRRVSPFLALGASAWFVALLAGLLASLPSLASSTGVLTVVQLAFGLVAAPLLLAAAWRAVRHGPERD